MKIIFSDLYKSQINISDRQSQHFLAEGKNLCRPKIENQIEHTWKSFNYTCFSHGQCTVNP